MIDPGTAFLVGKGIDIFGGLFGGESDESKNEKLRLEEARRQFDLQHGLQSELGRGQQTFDQVGSSSDVLRQMQNAPLRDQAAYMLMARMGQAPGDFRANDMFNPSSQPAQQGGLDAGALQSAAGKYTPGAGGVDQDPYKVMLGRLGLTQGANGGWQMGQPTISSPTGQAPQAPMPTPPTPSGGPPPTVPPGPWNRGPTDFGGPPISGQPQAPRPPVAPSPGGFGGPTPPMGDPRLSVQMPPQFAALFGRR